jgi:glycosyltransferase involved in cell wall biosynthesis
MKPAISVIMTVFNAGAYLRDAVDSILSQTLRDLEFIIVNDGSTDDTENIIRSFSDPRIIYMANPVNIGQTSSLNKAISISKGEYIARMDADDISFPGRLAEQFEYHEKNPSVAVVGTWHQEIDKRGRLIRKCFFPEFPTVKARLTFSRLAGWASVSHPTVMMRRAVFDEIGYYDPEYSICQDYDLWLRIVRKYPIENIPKVLFGYRVHGSSLTKKFSGRTMDEYHAIISNNMDHFMTGLDAEKRSQLFYMLCNIPQRPGSDIDSLFSAFDDYYSRVLAEELKGARSSYYRDLNERLKIQYIPQLAKTHKGYTGRLLARALFRHPSRLVSRNFLWSVKNSFA